MTEDTAAPRRKRTDARRNVEALLDAAKTVFGTSGVDAPAKEITDLAGVGVGTLYRHFPQRSDLIKAVIEREIDACAEAAPALAAEHAPGEALARWLDRLAAFVATKRGFAAALHSGDPAYDGLSGFFMAKLGPALESLLDSAVTAGEIRAGVSPQDLLYAVAKLCAPLPDEEPGYGRRMTALLVEGLRSAGR
ncbi:TetR/AcrR family transcriptional regulator [Paractinoplanes lichenicola]|uniref:TetR/AcrR family transcriptional regulator n=1 Tax=Paractinoplanes lichenicola TaxID=2802976 RepID=UPI0027DB1C45|nr:TetR/AcrR family transcriptional regulator [Actinoplanes lichenicola]